MIADRWSEIRQEWKDLDRDKRIIVVWESSNLAATVALPFLLLFTFLFWSPSLPPVNILLGLIAIGVLYGVSIIFQRPILDYYGIDENP